MSEQAGFGGPIDDGMTGPDDLDADTLDEVESPQAQIDEAIADEPTFATDDFDPRSDVHDQVFALDNSLTMDGGGASSDHHGLHDLGDTADLLDDIGDVLGG